MPMNNENMPTDTKPTPRMGRPEGEDGQEHSAGDPAPIQGSLRKAGVIIRASVEHVALAGETELTVNVKWPASAFCVPPCATPAATDASQSSLHVPANAPSAKIRTVTGTK